MPPQRGSTAKSRASSQNDLSVPVMPSGGTIRLVRAKSATSSGMKAKNMADGVGIDG